LCRGSLYSNLTDITANDQKVSSEAVLCLTSTKLTGAITSVNTEKERSTFFERNNFSPTKKLLAETVMEEARKNNFVVKIQFSQ